MCASEKTVDDTILRIMDVQSNKDDIDDAVNRIKTLAYGIGDS